MKRKIVENTHLISIHGKVLNCLLGSSEDNRTSDTDPMNCWSIGDSELFRNGQAIHYQLHKRGNEQIQLEQQFELARQILGHLQVKQLLLGNW